MDSESVGMSETQSSDTIIELKTHADAGRNKSTDQKSATADSGSSTSDSKDTVLEKQETSSPLDVTDAQNIQEGSGPKTPTSASPVTGQMLDRRKTKERKIGHRRVDEEGQITFKKIQTSQIMGSIQLGIGHAVGRLASKPERDLLMHDFTIVESTYFSKDGSNMTPAHHYSDFRFKAYAPVAFRYFRDLFGIQPDDFLLSLCNNPMRELTNPGASGSIFYLTEDDEFIIKTVQHKEAEFLIKLLPGYYMNLNQNKRTLLPKFFGLYTYQCGGKNVRLVVMNNLLPSSVKLHEKYDLKGSTYKRKANKHERKKSSPTYKDLDFMERHPDGIYLEADNYNAMIKTIQRDCRVLESFKIMDYSLLVGVYNLDMAKREKMERRKIQEEQSCGKISEDSECASSIQVSSGKTESNLVRSRSINRQRLAAFSTAMESIQAENEAPNEDDDVPPGGVPAKNAKGEQLLLFLGIIDILQSFRLAKKLEHTWKSVIHDGDTVSVHRPGFYSQRFQDFMSKTVFKKNPALKHSPSKRKAAVIKQRTSASSESDIPKTNLPQLSNESGSTQQEVSVPSSTFPESPTVSRSKKNNSSSLEKLDISSNTYQPNMIDTKSISIVAKASSITGDKTEIVSLSQINIETESTTECASETSSQTSGFGSTLHPVTWTPPLSVEGSTPTHTEGTPSYTESSSSGDAACPTTPVKSIGKSLDSLSPFAEIKHLKGSEVTRL